MRGFSAPRRVWFVTGSSSGLGRAVVVAALRCGDAVAATARDPASLAALGEVGPGPLLPLTLDVTRPAEVRAAVAAVLDRFGCLDVVVNNAGYGLVGGFDAIPDRQLRAQLETNFFGVADVTRAVLPSMLARGTGRLLFVSSIAGRVASAGAGAYAASKFAVEGLAEALAREVAPSGLRVTILEPGVFRSAWAGRSLEVAEGRGRALSTAAVAERARAGASGQRGDPAGFASVVLAVVDLPDPPLRLAVGPDAYQELFADLREKVAELRRFEWLSLAGGGGRYRGEGTP